MTMREIMKQAWRLYRKGFSEKFGACLKASWSLAKQVKSLNRDEKYTVEEIQKIVPAKYWRNANFRAAAADGDGSVRYELTNLWAKAGIARIYVYKYANQVIIKDFYLEVRI